MMKWGLQIFVGARFFLGSLAGDDFNGKSEYDSGKSESSSSSDTETGTYFTILIHTFQNLNLKFD